MSWSGGVFTRAHDWTADAAADIDIEAVRMDQEDDNFEAGINNCLTKDGQNSPTADLPMGGNRHTGVGNANARNTYASAADIQDQDLIYFVDSGAADAYVITPSPAITAYEEGQRFVVRVTNTNNGASTLNANALGATAIELPDGTAMSSGMLAAGGIYEFTYDANGLRFVLTSPHSLTPSSGTTITAGSGLTGGGDLSANRTLNVGAGTGITVGADSVSTNDGEIVHDNLSGFVSNEHINHASVSISPGTGLTGGGTIAATRTLSLDTGSTRNTDHAGISVNAGSGLTGGGTISSDRTINVGAGLGITVNANDVAINMTIQSDPGGTPSGSAGELFLFY